MEEEAQGFQIVVSCHSWEEEAKELLQAADKFGENSIIGT